MSDKYICRDCGLEHDERPHESNWIHDILYADDKINRLMPILNRDNSPEMTPYKEIIGALKLKTDALFKLYGWSHNE